MEKVYGPKEVNSVKSKHKRDVTDITLVYENRQIMNYQGALNLLEESKSKLSNLENELSSSAPLKNKELADSRVNAEDKINRLRDQLTAVAEAEKQISKQIQKSIRSKQEEVKDKVSELYRRKKFEQLEQELIATMEQIQDSHAKRQQNLDASGFASQGMLEDDEQNQSKISGTDDIDIELIQEDID